MNTKKYYAERKGVLKPEPMDFDMFKQVFLSIYKKFEDKIYFQQATGYTCVDAGKKIGLWGHNIDAYIYTKLKMNNIWPIQDSIDNFDENTMFSVIEFLYDYVSEPIEEYKKYHSWDSCGWHCSKFDKEKGKEKFRNELNEILKEYDHGYQLTVDGEIHLIPPTGFEFLVEEPIKTDEPEDIDKRIKNAISKYLKYSSTVDDKKDAIRTLGDVMEYLKKSGITLPSKDDSDLFQIINRFNVRHHNKSQIRDYDKEIWNDWMFYTFLVTIKVLLKIKNIKTNPPD